MHISYLEQTDLCLMLVSNDKDKFFELSEARDKINNSFIEQGLLKHMVNAAEQGDYSLGGTNQKQKTKRCSFAISFFFFSRHWYRRVETFHVHEQEYDAVRHMPVGGPIHGYLFLFFCFVLFCFADRICRPEGPTTRDAPVPAHAPPRPRACADPQDSLHGRQDRGRDWVDRPRV